MSSQSERLPKLPGLCRMRRRVCVLRARRRAERYEICPHVLEYCVRRVVSRRKGPVGEELLLLARSHRGQEHRQGARQLLGAALGDLSTLHGDHAMS